MIRLKRDDNQNGVKNDTQVDIFRDDGVIHVDGSKYKLTCVMYHRGKYISSGHYFVEAYRPTIVSSTTVSRKWLMLNDKDVNLTKEDMGASPWRKKECFLLLYYKCKEEWADKDLELHRQVISFTEYKTMENIYSPNLHTVTVEAKTTPMTKHQEWEEMLFYIGNCKYWKNDDRLLFVYPVRGKASFNQHFEDVMMFKKDMLNEQIKQCNENNGVIGLIHIRQKDLNFLIMDDYCSDGVISLILTRYVNIVYTSNI